MPLIGPEGRKQLKSAARLSAVGLEVGISILIGALGGYWLDGKLDTSPYLSIAGLLLGAAAATKSLYETVRKYRNPEASDDGND